MGGRLLVEAVEVGGELRRAAAGGGGRRLAAMGRAAAACGKNLGDRCMGNQNWEPPVCVGATLGWWPCQEGKRECLWAGGGGAG